MAVIGYARVSTSEQSTDIQIDALKDAGAELIFAENASGANAARDELTRAIDTLNEGDTLLVVRLDRLARSLPDLFTLLDKISKKGAKFKSLNEAWADTTTAQGRFMIAVIGGAAEFERELIIARTSEGRARALSTGVKFGRPPKMSGYQRSAARKMIENGMTQVDVARMFSVSPATICVMVKEQAHHG